MSARRIAITESLIHDIALRVQGGTYPHVAAAAAGVPPEVFHDWMERGSRPGARDPYRALAERVRRAHAHARSMAEIQLRRKDAKAWLLNGPGKGSDDVPGWSAPLKGQPAPDGRALNLLLDPQMQELLAAILEVLAPHPEARAALAAALEQRQAAAPAEAVS